MSCSDLGGSYSGYDQIWLNNTILKLFRFFNLDIYRGPRLLLAFIFENVFSLKVALIDLSDGSGYILT